MSRRKLPEAYMIFDGDTEFAIVRGVETMAEAALVAIADERWRIVDVLSGRDEHLSYLYRNWQAAYRSGDLLADAQHKAAIDQRVEHLLTHHHPAEPAWYRLVPCAPQTCGLHGWHWSCADGPGRGNWRGILLEAHRLTPCTCDGIRCTLGPEQVTA